VNKSSKKFKISNKKEMRGLEDKDRLEQNQCQTFGYSLSQCKLSTGIIQSHRR